MESQICPQQVVLVIESDASNQGWGARCGDTSTGGSWSVEEAAQHINYLELMAAFLTLCHQSEGHDPSSTVQLSPGNMGMVSPETNITAGRAPTRHSEYSSRHRIQSDEGLMRLDDQSISVPTNTAINGSYTNRPFCLTANQTATSLLQLEARPGCRGNQCLHTELGKDKALHSVTNGKQHKKYLYN